MKGEETENKKVGCTVNLMVRGHELFLLTGTARVSLAWVWKLFSKQETLTLCMFCILLQNFYKSEINKEEMYIRYIHKLCDMHLQAENYTGESGKGELCVFIRKTWGQHRTTPGSFLPDLSNIPRFPFTSVLSFYSFSDRKQVKLLSFPSCAPWCCLLSLLLLVSL